MRISFLNSKTLADYKSMPDFFGISLSRRLTQINTDHSKEYFPQRLAQQVRVHPRRSAGPFPVQSNRQPAPSVRKALRLKKSPRAGILGGLIFPNANQDLLFKKSASVAQIAGSDRLRINFCPSPGPRGRYPNRDEPRATQHRCRRPARTPDHLIDSRRLQRL